ncbi:MATE family efflux transporter [Cellvibrio fontiphilus]|uniref:MATE family efflux transporter n=1 Tax=Cellvibrio fontiphilus TaxID=1815559 RepID=A0ABV7F8S7_9GAMM
MAEPLQATLTEGRVSEQLKSLALPLVWGLMATMSLNAIETFFIAQLGREPLAALSFTFPVIMVLTSLGIGLGAGTSSAVARAIGEGDSNKARRLATDAMSLTFIISASVCLLGWLTLEPLFLALGATPELIPLIRSYMAIWYFSAPCLMVPMVCLSALRAMGMSQVQGYLMGGAALLNVLLDPLLIFGLLGFPAMGLQGAAVATLITRVLMLVVAIYILHARVHMLVNPFLPWARLQQSWMAIIEVGVPAMVANVIIPFASAIVVAMVAAYGTDAVAALGIAMRIEPLALIVFYALSGVIGPFFGQNSGAGRLERLHEALRVLTLFCLLFGLLLAVILGLLGAEIASLFGGHQEVVNITAAYFMIVPISYGAYGLVMAVNAAFNGLGRPWPAMIISSGRVFYIYLPLAWVGQHWFGITGIFVATATANVMLGLWAWYWLNAHIKQQSSAAQP